MCQPPDRGTHRRDTPTAETPTAETADAHRARGCGGLRPVGSGGPGDPGALWPARPQGL